jgi:hypothetical protein
VFGPAYAGDCLLLQRFALEDFLEFNAENYFLARICALLKREDYCGILTFEATKRRRRIVRVTSPFPVTSELSSKVITQRI